MSREYKKISTSKLGLKDSVYESFGWEIIAVNDTSITMTRDKQSIKYTELVKYEVQYEELLTKRDGIDYPKYPKDINLKVAFFLFILFVVPGIIYICIKVSQDKVYNEKYSKAETERMRIEEEMNEICNLSRAILHSIK